MTIQCIAEALAAATKCAGRGARALPRCAVRFELIWIVMSPSAHDILEMMNDTAGNASRR